MRLLQSGIYVTGYVAAAGSGLTRPAGVLNPDVGGGQRASFFSVVLRATASNITVGQCTLDMRANFGLLEGTTYISMCPQNMQSATITSSAAAVNLGTSATQYEAFCISPGGWGAPIAGNIPADSYDIRISGATTGNQTWNIWYFLWGYGSN